MADMDIDAPLPNRMYVQEGPIPKINSAQKPIVNVADKQPSLIELKNGKIIFRQKLLLLDRMMSTMKEMVAFNEMLQSLTSPLPAVPDAHLPLIAKLVNESDKTLPLLAKRLKSTLLPETATDSQEEVENDDDANLPLEVLERAIVSVADRINYGIDGATAALSLWRWEAKDSAMLPAEVREKCLKRKAEREQARRDISDYLQSLDEGERAALLPNKERAIVKDVEKIAKAKQKENKTPEPKNLVNRDANDSCLSERPDTLKKEGGGRPKKILDAESLAAAKDREDKATARAEKKRKTGMAQAKAAATMTAWLGKTKLKPRSSTGPPTPSWSKSEFELTFPTFVCKKDTEVAPINKFTPAKAKARETLVLNSDGDILSVESMDVDLPLAPGPKEILQGFLSNVPHCRRLPHNVSVYKIESKCSVRDIMERINEAEVNGDAKAVRQLQAALRSRWNAPAKLIQFHDNARPAYFGTWTRSSTVVGPRTPFAKELSTFDYSYDSGDDWNDEEGGEDVMSDDGHSERDTATIASDEEEDEFAGWMVDDDEVEEVDNGTPPPLFDFPEPPSKRKRASSKEAKQKKRKIVTTLIAFSKGPCWETTIGVCDYEPFLDYRIQFLNDTPFPLDPFTYVAPDITLTTNSSDSSAKAQGEVRMQVPELASTAAATSTSTSGLKPRTTAVVAPKHPFPDQHLPAFLQAVEGSTKTRPLLIEDLFATFQHLGVKKNAIDAKLKEVGVKDKKVWKVLEDAWKHVGVGPPMAA